VLRVTCARRDCEKYFGCEAITESVIIIVLRTFVESKVNRNSINNELVSEIEYYINITTDNYYFFIFSSSAAQRGLWPPRFTRFLHHTQRRATFGRTPLDE
jgi:hypothetical protein